MGHVNITATTVAAVHGKAETVGALVAQPLKG
jgi:hypothetical protein